MNAQELALVVPVTTSVGTILALTDGQKATLEDRCRRFVGLMSLTIFRGTGGLPDDYVYVIWKFDRGNDLHSGIDPDGRMST